jgi:hypothetical protein
MTISGYLETLPALPLHQIAKFPEGPPKDTVPLTGAPRQHPSEKNKIILIYDPLGNSPKVLELKLEDVLYVEEVHSAVTELGEGLPLVKLWIRKGAHGVMLEPFEVDDPIRFGNKRQDQDRFLLN